MSCSSGTRARRSDARNGSLKSAWCGLRVADLDAAARRSLFQWPFVDSGWPGVLPSQSHELKGEADHSLRGNGSEISKREEDGCWIRRERMYDLGPSPREPLTGTTSFALAAARVWASLDIHYVLHTSWLMGIEGQEGTVSTTRPQGPRGKGGKSRLCCVGKFRNSCVLVSKLSLKFFETLLAEK